MDNRIAYIELLGLTLSGHKSPDQGLYWTDLEGWWGLPDLRGEADLKPGTHGRFRRGDLLRESRVITLVGHILCSSSRELAAARDRLEHALSAGSGHMRVVTGETGSWERYVEIDTLTIEPDHGKRWTKFTVDMVAPDPRRYGPLVTAGPIGIPVSVGGLRLPKAFPWNFGTVSGDSRMSVHNSGLIDMFPTIRVAGGFSFLEVTNISEGNRISLEWPVEQDSSVVLDSGSRRARQDGSDITRWLTSREWFSIPPGESHEFRFEVRGLSGDPRMWIEYREGAW